MTFTKATMPNVSKKVKVLDETCSIHPDTHLQKFNGNKFCPECVLAQNDRETSEKATRAIESRKTKMLNRNSVLTDSGLKTASFKTYKRTSDEATENGKKAYELAKKYCDRGFQANVIISGKPGKGKSHLAYSMLKYVNTNSEQPQSCVFVSWDELLRKVKNSFRDGTSKFQEEYVMNLLCTVDLLVIDDLGTEANMQSKDSEATNWSQTFLYQVLNARDRTIITTNLTSRELNNTYNPKVVSRIGKKLHAIKFTDKTNDYRRAQLDF